MGRQVDRAVRRGLHPAEARLQPRAHHHPQVAAARLAGPARQAAVAGAAAARGHRAAQVSAPYVLRYTARSSLLYKFKKYPDD